MCFSGKPQPLFSSAFTYVLYFLSQLTSDFFFLSIFSLLHHPSLLLLCSFTHRAQIVLGVRWVLCLPQVTQWPPFFFSPCGSPAAPTSASTPISFTFTTFSSLNSCHTPAVIFYFISFIYLHSSQQTYTLVHTYSLTVSPTSPPPSVAPFEECRPARLFLLVGEGGQDSH